MVAFSVDEAQLVSLFMSSIFYGGNLVSVGLCISVLLSKKQREPQKSINWLLLVSASAMAFLATLNVALGFRNVFSAFILYKGPGGPEAAFNNRAYWASVLSNVANVLQMLIGDAILIYRCYIIYDHKWPVVGTSVLLWFSGAVCGAFTIFNTSTAKIESTDGGVPIKPFLTAFFGVTLLLNLITTGLIVYRIWSINKLTSSLESLYSHAGPTPLARTGTSSPIYRTRLARVMRIVIEAGLVYTTTALLTFVTYLARSNASHVLTDILIQVTGISFNFIIIRLDYGSPNSYPPRANPKPTHTIQTPPALLRPAVIRVPKLALTSLSGIRTVSYVDSPLDPGLWSREKDTVVESDLESAPFKVVKAQDTDSDSEPLERASR